MDMKTKKRTTAEAPLTPSHMVVLPWKSASSVTAKEYPRMKKEKRTRAQKKRFCWRFRGGSAEMMGLRAILATTIWKK